MYTATFANQTGTQSHKHHLSLELELRIRHSTNYKTTTTTCVYRVPNLYTPGNHNFHNLGPLGNQGGTQHGYTQHWRLETSCVGTWYGTRVSKKTMLYRTYVTPITRLLNSSWRSLFSIWRSSILEPPHRFDPPLF